jgi:hypothetical protein
MTDLLDFVDASTSIFLCVRVDQLADGEFAIMGRRFRGGWVEMERFDTLVEAVRVARYIPVRSERAIMCHVSCIVVAGARFEFACVCPWERHGAAGWLVFAKVRRKLALAHLSFHEFLGEALDAAAAVEVETPAMAFYREHPFLSLAVAMAEKMAEVQSA